jgi:hypothetical protein
VIVPAFDARLTDGFGKKRKEAGMLLSNSGIGIWKQCPGFMRVPPLRVRVSAPERQTRFPAVLATSNFISRKTASSITGFESPSHATLPGVSGCPSGHIAGWGQGEMMRHLCDFGGLIRRLRIRARYGELSRAPLQLLRLELRGGNVECEWIARPPDPWDANLPPCVGYRNASQQALQDAIAVREILFLSLPDVGSALVRVYRRRPCESLGPARELIITGALSKVERPPAAVRSLAMRAKLCGFQFWLDDGILEALRPEECAAD